MKDIDLVKRAKHIIENGGLLARDTALALIDQLEAAQSEQEKATGRITKLESSIMAPGIMRCAKCSFVLTKNIINMSAGTITAGDSKSEPCPNGCGPLWPVTWKEQALQARDDSEKWFEELQDARAELKRRDEQKPIGFINAAREPVLYGENIGIAMGTDFYAAAPAALNSPVIPDGWVMAPTKASAAMIRAGGKAAREYLEEYGGNSPRVIYQAMLAAATAPGGGDV